MTREPTLMIRAGDPDHRDAVRYIASLKTRDADRAKDDGSRMIQARALLRTAEQWDAWAEAQRRPATIKSAWSFAASVVAALGLAMAIAFIAAVSLGAVRL